MMKQLLSVFLRASLQNLEKNLEHLKADPDASIPGHAAATTTSFGPSSKDPYTETWVDTSLTGGVFEKTPYIGFGILCMSGTSCVFPLCRKTPTCFQNTSGRNGCRQSDVYIFIHGRS
jgi:hypothetical protein